MLGGTPWHDPQNTCVPPSVLAGVRNTAAVSVPSFVPPPWQYVFEQEVPFQAGVAPLATASPEKMTSAGSAGSRCPSLPTSAGTRWHVAQAIGAAISTLPKRCAWWAPTPRKEEVVLPSRSRGGAADCALP